MWGRGGDELHCATNVHTVERTHCSLFSDKFSDFTLLPRAVATEPGSCTKSKSTKDNSVLGECENVSVSMLTVDGMSSTQSLLTLSLKRRLGLLILHYQTSHHWRHHQQSLQSLLLQKQRQCVFQSQPHLQLHLQCLQQLWPWCSCCEASTKTDGRRSWVNALKWGWSV